MVGEIERRADFPLVASMIFIDPGADRNFEAEFSGDRRHKFGAARRRIGPDSASVRCNGTQIGPDLRGRGRSAPVRMGGIGEWRIGDAGELPGNVRSYPHWL